MSEQRLVARSLHGNADRAGSSSLTAGGAGQEIGVVRIHFNKVHGTRARESIWSRVTRPPIAIGLARDALKEGIYFGLVTIGAAGFVRRAKDVVTNTAEHVPENLPSCVELVGEVEKVLAFVNARKSVLRDAIVIQVRGELLATTDPDTCVAPGS